MDYVLEKLETEPFLDMFHKLLQLKARRFIIRGATRKAIEFAARARQTFEGKFDFKLILCDTADPAEKAPSNTLLPAQAYRGGCDAVMIFSENVDEIFDEIDRLAPKVKFTVYHATPPRKCLFVSFPKCGTNLLALLIYRLGFKLLGSDPEKTTYEQLQETPDGVHLLRHFVDDISSREMLNFIENKELSVLFNYRDPKAQANSYVNFFSSRKFENYHATANPVSQRLYKLYSEMPDTHSRLKYFLSTHILSEKYHVAFQTHAYLFLSDKVCQVRYERLAGARGGGSHDTQVMEVRKVMRHLRVGGQAEEIARDIYRTDTASFHSGSLDSWRPHFNEEIMALFKKRYPQAILDLYGYG